LPSLLPLLREWLFLWEKLRTIIVEKIQIEATFELQAAKHDRPNAAAL